MKFGASSLSSSPTEWGQFGDYIGGTLNPFLSSVNIIVLGYLTYQVSHLDQVYQTRSLDTQRKLVLSQLRHEAMQDYMRTIDSVLHNYDEAGSEYRASVGQKANVAAEKIKTLNENLLYLFPIMKELIFESLVSTLYVIVKANAEFLRITKVVPLNEQQMKAGAISFANSIDLLREQKRMAMGRLQNFLMVELNS